RNSRRGDSRTCAPRATTSAAPARIRSTSRGRSRSPRRGWWIESSQARMLAPRPLMLRAIPIAWTPSTEGPLSAAVIVAPMTGEKDFADWKGKLSGKIVLVTWPAPIKDDEDAPFHRLSDTEIAKLDHYAEPVFDPEARQ